MQKHVYVGCVFSRAKSGFAGMIASSESLSTHSGADLQSQFLPSFILQPSGQLEEEWLEGRPEHVVGPLTLCHGNHSELEHPPASCFSSLTPQLSNDLAIPASHVVHRGPCAKLYPVGSSSCVLLLIDARQ